MKAQVLFLAVCLACFDVFADSGGQWSAPKNPDLDKVLTSARADISARHYADALAKHIWFHENVLKIDDSFRGVRLSFAMSEWVELGKAYPPAMAALKKIRDEDEMQIRGPAPEWQSFTDFESINKYLTETNRTSEAFVWLDKNNPSFAAKIFELAEGSLVVAKEYRLCLRYLDTQKAFEQYLQDYHGDQQRLARMNSSGNKGASLFQNYMEERFSNHTATLVALLAIDGQKPSATSTAADALKEWNSPKFAKLLDQAKNGEVPPPWP